MSTPNPVSSNALRNAVGIVSMFATLVLALCAAAGLAQHRVEKPADAQKLQALSQYLIDSAVVRDVQSDTVNGGASGAAISTSASPTNDKRSVVADEISHGIEAKLQAAVDSAVAALDERLQGIKQGIEQQLKERPMARDAPVSKLDPAVHGANAKATATRTPPPARRLGVEAVPATDRCGRVRGLTVTKVVADSPAVRLRCTRCGKSCSLRPGMIIVQVNGTNVSSVDELTAALQCDSAVVLRIGCNEHGDVEVVDWN